MSLCTPGSFQAPWCSLGACGEQYCLNWESRFLRDLGSALDTIVDGLVSMVAQEALKYTVLSGRFSCRHGASWVVMEARQSEYG